MRDCAFCSAWTFYGRSYRPISPERVADDLASLREPGAFIVDDVAFVHAEHGMAIGAEGLRKLRKRASLGGNFEALEQIPIASERKRVKMLVRTMS